MFLSVGLSLILIPRYGAVGAAIATCATLVTYNMMNQVGLRATTKINFFQWHYLRVYASILLGALALVVFQRLMPLPIYVAVGLAGLISLIVLLVNRSVLNVEQTFPELLRFKLIRRLFATNRNEE
jgi:O-antigen/teichoic acid export membrane protein